MQTAEALLLLTDNGKIVWANTAASEILGYPRAELCNMALPVDEKPSEQAPSGVGPVAHGLRELLAGRADEAKGDARIPDANGRRIEVRWKLCRLPDVGRDARVLCAFSDAAQSSSETPATPGYREIFENAIEGIFRFTIDGRLLEVNPALARMCGYGSPAAMVAALHDIPNQLYVRPEQGAKFERAVQETGFVAGWELEVWRADRTTVWVAVFARLVRDEAQQPLYYEGGVIDVTERKRSEAALKASEEMFRRLAETTRVVPFEFDLQSQSFIYVGPQAELLLGHPLVGGSSFEFWRSMLCPEDVAEGSRFARIFDDGELREFQTEFRVCAPDGRVIWVRQIVDAGGEGDAARRVRGFLFDVTEAKGLEVERENSRLELREMAARNQQVREEERISIAREIHDELGQALTLFRIDLAWLGGRLAKLVEDELRKPLDEKLGSMEQMIQATLQTVHRILSALRPPLLDELGLKEAIEFHAQEFSKRLGIRCEVNLDHTNALPRRDATAVFRIFQEILTNVARHAKASRVNVLLYESDTHLILQVEDNGCGISQAKVSRSKSYGILGMQERAWAIGGEVEMHRPSQSGTRVTIKVPLGGDEGRTSNIERPTSNVEVQSTPQVS